jgi:hypothetical protein
MRHQNSRCRDHPQQVEIVIAPPSPIGDDHRFPHAMLPTQTPPPGQPEEWEQNRNDREWMQRRKINLHDRGTAAEQPGYAILVGMATT